MFEDPTGLVKQIWLLSDFRIQMLHDIPDINFLAKGNPEVKRKLEDFLLDLLETARSNEVENLKVKK